jgi:hypothetical protein
MSIVSRTDQVAIERRTVRGTRAGCRQAVADYGATGRLLTFTEPVPDPDALGRFRIDLVLAVDDSLTAGSSPAAASTAVVIRQVPAIEPPAGPAPSRSVAARAYRRTRSVQRSSVVRTAKITGCTIGAAAVLAVAYEIVMGIIALCAWIAAHLPVVIGAGVVCAILAAILYRSLCPTCGR